MQAWLEGTILYVGNKPDAARIWADDITIDEACEIMAELHIENPNAPTGVRAFSCPIPKFDPITKRRQK